MSWEETIFKKHGLYKIERSAFSVPRLRYRDIELDTWIRECSRTLPVIHRIDTAKGNHQFRIESLIHLSSIVNDYSQIFDLDYMDTFISNEHPKRAQLEYDEVSYDTEVNGQYYCVKYPLELPLAYKTGRIALHHWRHDPINASSRMYDPKNTVDMYLDIPVDENWLMTFCRSLEEEKYSSSLIDKLYMDITSNFFHLHDVINVATGRSLFNKKFLQYTKFELYYDVSYENLNGQDPFVAIGTYFKDGQTEYISLPLLLLE